MIEEHDNLGEGLFDFNDVARVLRDADPDLYTFMVRNIQHKNWHVMMAELQVQKPELYTKVERIIDGLKEGKQTVRNSPEVDIYQAAWDTAKELKASYLCGLGVMDVPPPKQTALVHLKLDDVIMGLPRDLMALSNSLAEDYGGFRKWTFGFDNRMFVVDLEDAAIEELRKSPLVDQVVINPMAHILYGIPVLPYDPNGINTDWGVERMRAYFNGATQGAWPKGNYGENIKVCVIDTGIKKEHEVFWKDGVCVYKGGHNFVSGGDNPADDHDHGTYCCSIVAGQHNGILGSYRGLAPNIELYACKVLDSKGSGNFTNIAAGVDWARTNGMDVISMSLGGSAGASVLETACNNAWYAGLIILAAAGNSGPNPNTVNWPAMYQSCMAVAAMDYNEDIASFSSRGPKVEISAPGRYITGALAGFTYGNYAVEGSDDRYMTASGTSAACPHVAAGAALIKSWYRVATNTQIRQWLRDYARDI
jgi:subtilisin family serine protease